MDLSLLKRIGEALELDSNTKYQEAYVKYVECILSVATNLLKSVRESGGQVMSTREVSRYVQLGQQSFDRVATLLKIISDQSQSSSLSTQKLSDPVPPLQDEFPCHHFSLDMKKTLSPMEVAYRQNRQLMMAYRARMSAVKTRNSNTASLSLTIQRKMAENLAIAKTQEEALAKKMKERQLRLEEQASRRFVAPIGMSEEEQEQRQIYKKILEYEQEAKWLIEWRHKLDSKPLDTVLINQLIQEILRCVDHPLTQLIKDYQFKVYEKLYPLVSQSSPQLKDIVVPLPEYLYPPTVKTDNTEDKEDNPKDKEDNSEDKEDIENSKTLKEEKVLNKTQLDQEKTCPKEQNTEVKNIPKDGIDLSNKNNNDLTEELSEDKQHEGTRNINNNVSSDDKENSNLDNRSERVNEDLIFSIPASEECNQDLPAESSSDKSQLNSNVELSEMNETESVCPRFDESESTCNQPKETKSSATSDDDNRSEDVDNISCGNIASRQQNVDSRCENVGSKYENVDSKSENVDSRHNNAEEDKISDIACDDDIKRNNESDDKDRTDDDGSCEMHSKDFTVTCEKTRKDLEEAMDKGQTLQKQLTIEMEQSQSLLVNFTKDYEKYNQENMDDLFEDDDDDGDDDSNTGANDGDDDDNDKHRLDISDKNSPHICNPTPSSDQSPMLPPSISHSSAPIMSDSELCRISEEAYHRHLKWISEDVHSYMEKLLVMFTIAYDKLDSPTGRDVCYASLEEFFFKSLWKYLLILYRCANKSKETLLAYHMTICRHLPPSSFGVIGKLCLTPRGGDDQAIAYRSAVDELRRVREHYTMLSKLECVVRVCRLVMTCVEEYYQADSTLKSPNVGADDLLPILSYIVIKSCLPQLVSECSAMSEFIHEGYIMGEEGYCLTSLQTAILHVASGRFSAHES